LKPVAPSSVFWHGEPLIDGDGITYLDDGFEGNGEVKVSHNGSMQIVNVTSDGENFQYRKEVGVAPNRIELNVQMNMPAYTNRPDKPSILYSFNVPIARLDGMTWRAYVGRTYERKEVTGTLTRQTPDGSLCGESSWIAFEGNGQALVFDLNPKGVSSYTDFGPGGVQGRWLITKKKEHLEFSFGGNAREYGGTFSSKVVIFEGRHADFFEHHAHNFYVYFDELPVEREFRVSTFARDGGSATNQLHYNPDKGYGFESVKHLNIHSGAAGSVVENAVSSDRDNTFKWDLARPALYVVTLRSCNPKGKPGAFSLWCNGEEKSAGLAIKAGKITTITFSQWLKAGTLSLGFKGPWAVNSIDLQMLLHKNEDYAFGRGFWLVDDCYEPTPVNSNKPNQEPVTYKVAISEINVPKQIVEPESVPDMKRDVLLPAQDAPEMAWRYNAFVGGLGVNNSGTFLEYDTPEKVTRRFTKLKNMGVNTVLVDGMLARHVHRPHLPRIQEKLKEMVQIGHGMGLKMLDHQDLTILWNKEVALRLMVEGIDYCQRTVNGNLVTRGWCLNNPDYRRHYFAWMKQFVKETKLDGIMIDEVCFHGKEFCGCQHCRAMFTEATGLVLPVETNSPVFFNMKSNLWKSWLEWRRKSAGDWWIAYRREIQSIRPDFCIMGYISEGGFQGKAGPLHEGADLSDSARAIDFLGTEIMSRNVMDNCRYVFSSRKSYNMLREAYGGPIFGLVYPLESSDFAYFGWAMNNMHAQATWSTVSQAKPEEAVKYVNWADNVDKLSAEPVVDIAIVFSCRSRDWSEGNSYSHDLYGVAQILTDRHIQHTIITEPCLTAEQLQKYRLVILPSMTCISDQHVDQIRQYVAGGGRLLITGNSGTSNEIGLARTRWAFADMLDIDLSQTATFEDMVTLSGLTGKQGADFAGDLMKIGAVQSPKVETHVQVVSNGGDILAPAVVSGSYGQGDLVYCAAALGAVNYQDNTNIRQAITFKMKEPLKNLLMDIVHLSLGTDPLIFTPVEMPEKVFTTYYQQNHQGKRSRVVHLLNGTGVTVKTGDRIPTAKSRPAFPALVRDLVFELQLPSLSDSYAVSPDYTGKRAIVTEKLSSRRYKISVPKEALQSYTVLYFHEN
jgi:hypothetical protein